MKRHLFTDAILKSDGGLFTFPIYFESVIVLYFMEFIHFV